MDKVVRIATKGIGWKNRIKTLFPNKLSVYMLLETLLKGLYTDFTWGSTEPSPAQEYGFLKFVTAF